MKAKSKEFEDIYSKESNSTQVWTGRMGRRNAMNEEDCEELVDLFGQLGMGEDEPSNAMLTIQEEVDRPVAPLNMQVNMLEREEDDAQEQKRSREEESDDESSVQDEEVLPEADSEKEESTRSVKRTRSSPEEDEGMEVDELAAEVSFDSEMQVFGREGDSALGGSVTPSRADRSLSCNFLRVNENPEGEMAGVVLPSFSFSMDSSH